MFEPGICKINDICVSGNASPDQFPEDEESVVNNSVLAIFQITNKTDGEAEKEGMTDSLSTFPDVPPVLM